MAKKTYHGVTNDKERSKQKLVDAVGVIIRTQGYTGLNASNVAKNAGVNRRLINLYFGNLDALVETYVRGKDYWVAASGNAGELMEENKGNDTRQILETLLVNQLDYFFKEEEMQKIVLWQISQRSQIMFEVAEEREKLGAAYFELTDPFFKKTDVDLRAVAGLLVGGIYYMVLHAKSNDSLFCQIDVNSPEGLDRIKNAIGAILKDTFRRAEIANNKN
ncbi:TetR/AcrR family transcriptional regulator [Mucilaginibacter gossypii]|uniref:DNA-binding transcriptional regulator, AcrR family n=1 Tax=Mucilaginibacter gossypii TaxID=551996 RepID=A0A1G8B8M3_9SPHI|nr:TetR/AcrR family transcriptional regulator [Mucilaginibacter gossypii]SDH29599.1 DNA-binding transcriptional regulator, AcrR family [Mucilaginibacter gossypii]